MKIKSLRNAFLFVSAALAAVSCAKKEEVGFDELEQRSLDAWMSINAPDATLWANGIYFESLEQGTGRTAQTNDWVRINFTGTDVWENVFVTRYEAIAREQSTFRTRTCYEPLFTVFDETNTTLIPAQIAVLVNGMKEGDSVRVYFPSRLGYGSYGSSYGYGYEGKIALSANVPGIITMKLVEVVPDANAREKAMVQDYAGLLNIDTPMIDEQGDYGTMTLDSLMYAKVTKPAALGADTIRKDSTIHIYYVGKFLDGFIFDTNIDSVALRVFGDNTEHAAMEYTPDTDRDSYVQAFYRIFDSEIPVNGGGDPAYVRYGDWVTMVFTSPLGYGLYGSYPDDNTANQTVIQQFTPLIFEFYAAHPPEDEE